MSEHERQPELLAKKGRREKTPLTYSGPVPEIDRELQSVLENRPRRGESSSITGENFEEVLRTTLQTAHAHTAHHHAPSYPKYSFENPPEKFTPVKKIGYALGGTLFAVFAVAGWTADAILHAFFLPHGSPLHAFFAALSVPSVTLFNAAWRGYSVTGKGPWGAMKDSWKQLWRIAFSGKHTHGDTHEHYKSDGYPVSGTTYAKENLNGHYEQTVTKRAMSLFVLYIGAPIVHIVEGFADAATEENDKVWAMPRTAIWPFGDVARGLAGAVRGLAKGVFVGIPQGWKSYKNDVSTAAGTSV